MFMFEFLVNNERVLLLAFLKHMLCSHCTENFIFCAIWRLKPLVLKQNFVQDLIIFVYFFGQKNTIDSIKTSTTQEQLVVESCPIPR